MSANIPLSEDQVQRRIEDRILPDPIIRAACLDIFADAIHAADLCDPAGWAVTVETSGMVRLHAGHTIICTLCPPTVAPPSGGIWMALDQKRLDESGEVRMLIDRSPDWEWSGPDDWGAYPSIGSRNGYYRPPAYYGSFWRQIAPLHFASIEMSIRKTKIDPRTVPHHQPAVLQYLRKVLKRDLPDSH